MVNNQNSQTMESNGISCPDLLKSLSDGVAVYEAVDNGQDFVFCEHNPAGEKITGIPRDKVIGKRVTDVFPGVAELGLLDVFRRVYETGIGEEHPTGQYQDDHVILWVENSVFRLSDGKIAAVYRDITERKRIEDELNHANNIINRSPVVAFLWKNEDGWPVQFVSENVVNLLGYTAEELTSGGISFDSLVHPDDYERVAFEVAEKSLQKDISTFTHSPYRFLIKNGETKWVHDTTSMRRDIHGRITHFEGIIYDISIQQLQQERINHLSNLRKTGLSIQRHLLSQKDNKELLQSICNVFVDEKGYRSAWIVLFNNKQDCRLTANAGLLKDFSELEQAIRDGNMPPCISRVMTEKRLIWKTSQQKLCAGCLMANGYPDTGLMAAPLAHDGQVYGVITVSLASDMVTDIEERELFEEVANDIAFSFYSREQEVNKQEQKKALQVALDEYADLYNNAPDMFVSVEAESARIQQCNKTLLDALGYERKDVIGQPVFMIYHPDSQIECKEKVFPTFCESGLIKNKELILQRKDGSTIPVTLDVSAVRDENGKILQSRSILHDISERKLLEEQVLVSEKMTTIAGLAAGVAHEINTPLSGILQSVQLVEMGLDPAEEQNSIAASDSGIDLVSVQDYMKKKDLDFFLGGIRDSATKAATIVAELLQFSSPQQSTFVQTDLVELLDRALFLAKSDYSMKKEFNILNVKFVKEYSPDLPEISCMIVDMEQVIINLIKNSCQAMAVTVDKVPQITIRTKQRGQMAVIEVEDNGPGIAEGIRQNIFDPFFTTKDVGQGTGLGLSVSYALVCGRHGGSLYAENIPGNGALFVIELPLLRVGA